MRKTTYGKVKFLLVIPTSFLHLISRFKKLQAMYFVMAAYVKKWQTTREFWIF